MSKLITISFTGTEEQKAMLERWARENDRSVSYVMRQILDQEAQRREPALTPQLEPVRQHTK